MSSNDVFAQEFRQMLAGIPEGTSLQQWQHMYRQAIIEMGLTIGERFKEQAARGSGFHPANPIEDKESGGHHPPGPRMPWLIAEFALRIE